jgi:hypothetical protein
VDREFDDGPASAGPKFVEPQVRGGEGRVVVYGAVLPTPSEDFDHWFGIAPYALMPLGQHLLLQALPWEHPDPGPSVPAPAFAL